MAPIDEVQFQGRIATSPLHGEVRRDGRPRQRLRADHRADRRGRPRRPRPPRRPMRGRRRPDHGDRPEHDDAGPAAARDRAPGAGDRGRAEGRRARAQGPGRRPQREAARDAQQRTIDNGDPDRRPGRDLAGRPGPPAGRLRDALRRRQGPLIPSGKRTWLDPRWRAEAEAWVAATLDRGRAPDRRADRAATPSAVVDRAFGSRPTGRRLVQGDRPRPGARRAVARRLPPAWGRRGRAAAGRRSRPGMAAVR